MAVIRAGYSEHTADVQGPRLLGKPHIAAALKLGRDALVRRTEVTAGRTLQHMPGWRSATCAAPSAPTAA